MTRPWKFVLAGALLASVAAVAVPTLAAQSGDSAGAAPKSDKLAFAGDWDRGDGDGPRHHGWWDRGPRGMGPGGGPGMGGAGGPGMGGPGHFGRGEFMYDRLLELLGIDDNGKVTPAQIDAAVEAKFKSYDKNNDGKITLDEYQAFWLDLTHERMVRSFQRLDREGAGAITSDAVTKPLDRVVQRLDRNGDGVINQADFERGPRGPGGAPPPPPPAPQQ